MKRILQSRCQQVEERLVNLEKIASVAPQSTLEMTGLAQASPQFFTILEEEVSNVKDSMTSGLLSTEHLGFEASGSGGIMIESLDTDW